MKRIAAFSLLLLFASFLALADAGDAFAPVGNCAALAVTSTSTATPVQVQGSNRNATQRFIYNDGPNTAFFAWCSTIACTAVVATPGSPANGVPVAAGATLTLSIPPNAFFAAITQAAKTSTLYICPGEGN